MRSPVLLFLLLLSVAAFADDLTVKVTSPNNQAVPNARVSVYPRSGDVAVGVVNTPASGVAQFHVPAGQYSVVVLAPSFRETKSQVTVSGETSTSVQLRIAAPEESVQVTATGTPMQTVNSAASVSTVDSTILTNQQPIALSDTLRFLPGAILSDSGQRGGLTALFVRGGESRYNKVIVDGVPVDEIGGQYDFGVASMAGTDRVEFMRGAQSTLYGSDAMTSVVQMFSAEGTTRTPELRFGAEGGTFSTARGYVSLAGARGRLDYNLFGEQIGTNGQGPNDGYSASSQGANIGVTLSPKALLRFRTRHENSWTGVPGEYVFGGVPLLPPDLTQYAHDNNFLSSLELTIASSAHWRHTFSGYEYNHRRYNADPVGGSCDSPFYLNCPFFQNDHQNRAGFNYRSEWTPLAWTRTTFGYDFEDENGFVDENFSGAGAQIHGLRRNHAGYVEQIVTWKRVTFTGGVRALHNESFGNKAVPRVAASLLALKGNRVFTGTHLRFSYAEGFKEPSFEESFGVGAFGILPNPALQPEENRSFETGFDQSFFTRYTLTATYFNNLFKNLVEFNSLTPLTSQYVNVNKAMAHGAEVTLGARLRDSLRLDASYTYDSTQILVAPLAFDPTAVAGAPLLRRPKHSGSLLLNYSGHRFGSILGGSFVGRRADSDFLFGAVPPVNHEPGYALVNIGGWYAANRHVTLYANVDNALDHHYEEVAGYPALRANFRAGMRFLFGGD